MPPTILLGQLSLGTFLRPCSILYCLKFKVLFYFTYFCFQHELMTSEYVIDEIAKSLDLNPNRFELVAALLGCHILTVSDLSEFHQKLVPELKQVGGGEDGKDYKVGFDRVIR